MKASEARLIEIIEQYLYQAQSKVTQGPVGLQRCVVVVMNDYADASNEQQFANANFNFRHLFAQNCADFLKESVNICAKIAQKRSFLAKARLPVFAVAAR